MSEHAFHEHFMTLAMREASKAAELGEVPAGCIIVKMPGGVFTSGEPRKTCVDHFTARVVGRAHNMTRALHDPTAHAEMIAITQAAEACGDWRLTNCILYVTKEPCPMCAGGIILARLPLVVWGFSDTNRGGHSQFGILDNPHLNHRPEIISGIMEQACKVDFQTFFQARRNALTKIGKENSYD